MTATIRTVTPGQQKFSAIVYFHSYKMYTIGNPNGIALLEITTKPPNSGFQKVYQAYITKSTFVIIGLVNLKVGDALYIEFDAKASLYNIELHNSADENLPVIATPAPVEKKIETDPHKCVNLVLPGVMWTCGAIGRDDRLNCYFFNHSTSRYKDCAHFRESMGDVCDCVAAHKHCQGYGVPKISGTSRAIPESQSYDELLRKRFGKKI